MKLTAAQREALRIATLGNGMLRRDARSTTISILAKHGLVDRHFVIREDSQRVLLETKIREQVDVAARALNVGDWHAALSDLRGARTTEEQLSDIEWWITEAGRAEIA